MPSRIAQWAVYYKALVPVRAYLSIWLGHWPQQRPLLKRGPAGAWRIVCDSLWSAIAGPSREAPVASLIDLCPQDQPQVPLSFDERRILSGETSIQGTSGLAHVSPVQADVTVATAHSRGQPKP